MAGIMANSSSVTMSVGDTATDNTASGYLAKETVTLTVSGSADEYSWALAKPTTSGLTCRLNDSDSPSPSFSPDVEGYYTITCLVDQTTLYILRLAVAQIGSVSTLTALRFSPIDNASIPIPAAGATIFYSSDLGGVAKKLPDGSVSLL